MSNYVLYESALGYAIFARQLSEEINTQDKQIQQNVLNYHTFSNMVKFVAFAPFETPEHGLENINSISEGVLHPFLRSFLENNVSVKKSTRMGVIDSTLASAIQDTLSIHCFTDDTTLELLRGIRLHFHRFVKDVKEEDVEKAQLGLGHAYSRAKVKFNVNRADNNVIQSIALVDQMDKDMNTFAMRLREWYSWHFPELSKIVKDNVTYAKLVKAIKDKSSINEESLHQLTEIIGDESTAEEVIAAARSSMGSDLSEFDMLHLEKFAARVTSLGEYRKQLHLYLTEKMHTVAPNLTTLLGEQVSARLIAKAGSMVNLAKYPASTLQILGAEKALFRALKTRGKTPKFGLIYHSSFIGKASKQNKGRISRYLANKCSFAARYDCFSEYPTTKYGEKLREQVEQRLKYIESGSKDISLQKNVEAMKEVKEKLQQEMKEKGISDSDTPKKRSRSSLSSKEEKRDEDDDENMEEKETPRKKQKKEKSKKKESTPKKSEMEVEQEETTPKKKEKKSKKKDKTPKKSEDAEEEEEEDATPKKKQKKEKKKEQSEDNGEETPKKKKKKNKSESTPQKDEMDVEESTTTPKKEKVNGSSTPGKTDEETTPSKKEKKKKKKGDSTPQSGSEKTPKKKKDKTPKK